MSCTKKELYKIIIHAYATASHVVMSVIDHGSGILPDDIPFIFDKFYRGKKTVCGGIGLGLPIAKSIVELHGGKIFVSQHKEGGTEFQIQLPIEEQPSIIEEH